MAWSRSLRLFASVCLCLSAAVECHLRPDGRGVCSRNTTTIMSYLSTGALTSRIMYRITRITDYQCCLGWFESGDECPIFGCMNECLNGGSCISNDTCACMPGYTGGACENDLDECTSGEHWCEQGCSNTIGSFVCTCEPGYYLGDDQSTCVDIDECVVSNGNCSEICLNFIGAFQCACRSGYAIADDGYNCTGIARAVSSQKSPAAAHLFLFYISFKINIRVNVQMHSARPKGTNKAKKKNTFK
ncbi:uncharacterized protein LOC116945577 [Petromyzon marinus]|uniref:uncharacterized protein LOC116945577 n=1 Tax=Petromyzon marinus TaxID=7757 RepID=UPI003F704277